ncbi:hypothetical protein [Bifidobacterium sp. SO4]|uniref:hypothetical protein n=1 Tax=Bifidobacterium sp. SO4 TaxID=2809030 RepID=UPI001BDDA9D5|nr:hypothetical protein [Bifidobacterium sp. SO4]MBT1170732.1 hypothetical protein [Bifidobacterium sp. SO4]
MTQPSENPALGTARKLVHPLESPIWLTGTNDVARESFAAGNRNALGNAAGIVIGAAAAVGCVIAGADRIVGEVGSMWVTNHGDDAHVSLFAANWRNIGVGLVFLLFSVVAVILAVECVRAEIRWSRIHKASLNPDVVGVRTTGFHAGDTVVFPDDTDNDGDPVKHPLTHIVFRRDEAPRTIRISAYLRADRWEELFGPDPLADWRHRHLMAWLTLSIDGDRLGLIGFDPIPPELVKEAYSSRSLPDELAAGSGPLLRRTVGGHYFVDADLAGTVRRH